MRLGTKCHKKDKEHCPAGHDLTKEENVQVRRECRICSRARVVAYRSQKSRGSLASISTSAREEYL